MPGAAPLSRRATVRGLAAALLTGGLASGLSGCDLGSHGSASPTNSSTPAPSSTPSPDQLLVDRAVARIGEVASYVSLVARRRHRLRMRLAPLTTLHLAHRKALGVTEPPRAAKPPAAVPAAAVALARVVAEESRLADQLAHLAEQSASGALARLLASMAAGVVQGVAVLSPLDPDSLSQPALDGPTARPAAELAVLQRTLAAEHAAIYVYGVLGAQTSQSDGSTAPLFAALTAAYSAHLARRDQLIASVVAAKAVPVPSAVSYDVPRRLDRTPVIERTAAGLESACAAEYAYLVAEATGPTRAWAIAVLRNAAVRELAFRGTPETFPGASEFADR